MLMNGIMKWILISVKISDSNAYDIFMLWGTFFLNFIAAKLKTNQAEKIHGTHLAKAAVLWRSFGWVCFGIATKEEHVLAMLTAPLGFTSSSAGKLLCCSTGWQSDSPKKRVAWKICHDLTKLWISEILKFTYVWGWRSGTPCFGRSGTAPRALLVPAPDWVMVLQPRTAPSTRLRKHEPAWGYSVSPYLHCLTTEGYCNTENSILPSGKRIYFFLYIKNVYFSKYAQKVFL